MHSFLIYFKMQQTEYQTTTTLLFTYQITTKPIKFELSRVALFCSYHILEMKYRISWCPITVIHGIYWLHILFSKPVSILVQ